MRVCPNCGTVDDPLWRQGVEFGINYMPLADFELINPNIVAKLLIEKYVEEGYYVYHLTKGRNVQRQAIMDNPDYGLHWGTKGYYERIDHKCPTNISEVPKWVRHRADKKQTRLLEVKE